MLFGKRMTPIIRASVYTLLSTFSHILLKTGNTESGIRNTTIPIYGEKPIRDIL